MTDFAFARLRSDPAELVELAQNSIRFGHDALAGFRQANFPPASMKEPGTEHLLQLLDLPA
jgi:hypothetical protein